MLKEGPLCHSCIHINLMSKNFRNSRKCFLKPSKLAVFVFLIIGSLVPALAVAEVMVQFNTGFFGTVGTNTQKANGISLMSNYDIDLIEVTQDLGDGGECISGHG